MPHRVRKLAVENSTEQPAPAERGRGLTNGPEEKGGRKRTSVSRKSKDYEKHEHGVESGQNLAS